MSRPQVDPVSEDVRKEAESVSTAEQNSPTSRRQLRSYAKEAARYDEGMDFFERRITGTGHRSWACSHATGRTLEVAIGTGLNLPFYPLDLQLVGVDLSSEMLAIAAERSRAMGLEIELLEANAQALPFADESFDTVLSTYALCSVPDDRTVIAEMRRVLKVGGRLILVDHVRSDVPPLFWLQWIWEFIPRRTKGEYMTRRPAVHIESAEFEMLARDRLRAGIVERLVAVKTECNAM